ncbi:hypothetical protein J3F83DRAFT_705034 [Trichoderma novae-zelandiae]
MAVIRRIPLVKRTGKVVPRVDEARPGTLSSGSATTAIVIGLVVVVGFVHAPGFSLPPVLVVLPAGLSLRSLRGVAAVLAIVVSG